jgi:hypothetical protein
MGRLALRLAKAEALPYWSIVVARLLRTRESEGHSRERLAALP